MRRPPLLLAALVLSLLAALLGAGCASAPPGEAPSDAAAASALLDRAIAAAGGAEALERSPALLWEGEAVVHAGGRDIALAGRWAVEPPDRAVVATWEKDKGEASTRRMIVAGDRGWTEREGQTTPMPPELLAHERDQFYLYSVLRLVPLREPGVRLTALAPDGEGRPGLRVARAGRREVDVYFEPAGPPAYLRTRITDPGSGREVVEEAWLSGTIEEAGIRWPRQIRLTWDGEPFFDLSLTRFTPKARLDDPRLEPLEGRR